MSMHATYSYKPCLLDNLLPDAVIDAGRKTFHDAPGRVYRRSLWPADFTGPHAAPERSEAVERSSHHHAPTWRRPSSNSSPPPTTSPQLPAGFPWWTVPSPHQSQVFLTDLMPQHGNAHEQHTHNQSHHTHHPLGSHSPPRAPSDDPSSQPPSDTSIDATAAAAATALRHALMGTTSSSPLHTRTRSAPPQFSPTLPWPWDQSQPRARAIPALLSTLPPLSTLPSLSSLALQIDHLAHHVEHSRAQLEVLSCLHTLSSLACLADLPSTQPPHATPTQPPSAAVLPHHKPPAPTFPSPAPGTHPPAYGSVHLSTTRSAENLGFRPTPNSHYLGYRTVAGAAAGGRGAEPPPQPPGGTSQARDPPLLSRLYPHIHSAALEVELEGERAGALAVQAALAAKLSTRHVVPAKQLAGQDLAGQGGGGLEAKAQPGDAAAQMGEDAAGPVEAGEQLERNLILPLNIDCVVKEAAAAEAAT